jgi:hypothetical protein
MWYPAEIVLKSYLPLELEEGMLFINRISVGIMEPYVELYELEEIPKDMDAFMALNGAPVELVLIDDDCSVIATHDQIGWWDDGDDDNDELRDITLEDINHIFRELDGYVDIETDEYGAFLLEDKVILTLVEEYYYGDEDPDEIWNETLNDGLEEEEEI